MLTLPYALHLIEKYTYTQLASYPPLIYCAATYHSSPMLQFLPVQLSSSQVSELLHESFQEYLCCLGV